MASMYGKLIKSAIWLVFWIVLDISNCGDIARAQDNAKALHGREWAFGQSGEREAALWKNGVSGEHIGKKAKPDKKKDAADTSAAINRAIKHSSDPKGRLGIAVSNETSTWKVAPEEKRQQPDETMFRDGKHVVRAFADVKPTDDLSISVGPELILKDEGKNTETAHENQPDSSLGVGMQFKLDF